MHEGRGWLPRVGGAPRGPGARTDGLVAATGRAAHPARTVDTKSAGLRGWTAGLCIRRSLRAFRVTLNEGAYMPRTILSTILIAVAGLACAIPAAASASSLSGATHARTFPKHATVRVNPTQGRSTVRGSLRRVAAPLAVARPDRHLIRGRPGRGRAATGDDRIPGSPPRESDRVGGVVLREEAAPTTPSTAYACCPMPSQSRVTSFVVASPRAVRGGAPPELAGVPSA